jgi:hypothetical protein
MVFKARDEKQQFHSPSQKDKLFTSLSLTLESSQGHATEPQPIKFGCLELSECFPFPLANELFNLLHGLPGSYSSRFSTSESYAVHLSDFSGTIQMWGPRTQEGNARGIWVGWWETGDVGRDGARRSGGS